MAFMPFVTAGDPNVEQTKAVITELANQGVDLIEVGFPYSDPIADGPVIQASYTRALDAGVTLDAIFEGIGSLESTPPLVAMVSYALIFRTGVTEFAKRAADAGFSGMIVPDLPGDEAADFAAVAKQNGLDLIQLVAPTSTPDRQRRILETCSGFVYCIAVSGTTGERKEIRPELLDYLKALRSQTDLPLAVGFGISQPDQVEPLRDVADGVIVGSAIVRRFTESENPVADIGTFAASMVAATRS